MRLWLKRQLSVTAGIIVLLSLVACHKPAPQTSVKPESDGMLVANAEPTRSIPRRQVPIVITNTTNLAPVLIANASTNANLMPPTPPTVVCGPAQTLPCASADGVKLTLTVHVEDSNGDPLSVVWSADGKDRYTQQVPAGTPITSADLSFSYTFTPGDHGVKVTVSDGLLSSSCDSSVTIQKDAQDPVIACPADISVFADPGKCSAVVTFAPSATDDCPDAVVVCEPPPGAPFPIGTTGVTCTATDGAGNSSSCSFGVTVQIANRCPQGDAYWRQNPGAWPVSSMVIGNQLYNRSQLTPLLRSTVSADASMVLARQLIAATLNTGRHSDPRPICGLLAQANDLLSGFTGKLPYRVNVSTPAGKSMLDLANILNGYNNGMLTANCLP